MFWGDRIGGEIVAKKGGVKKLLIIRDEKTASGRVHAGSLRGVALHGILSEVLAEKETPNRFLYEINDFDPMDGLPTYLDEATFKPHMGKPLYTIPSPDGIAKNYAEYFGEEFKEVINDLGFYPEFYRASELYLSGKMNEVIRQALLKADTIRKIYKEVSGSERKEDWLPISVICENCGKISMTRVTSFDGEKVHYTCVKDAVLWGEGCGHEGVVSPFDGKAKLPWKVEWAAKFKVLGVNVEGAGKDHSTKGGAREVADRISREVFEYEPPFDIPYEFFLVGGKKMSSSKGRGAAAREVADLVPPEILRLALIGKEPRQATDFEPEGDTIPVLFDSYDTLAEKYFLNVEDDKTRMFYFLHLPKDGKRTIVRRFLPRFSQIAFIVQMPHLDLFHEVERLKGSPLTPEDRVETELRARYSKKWLDEYAPEDFRFEIQKEIPEGAHQLSDKQKEALGELLRYIVVTPKLDGQVLHTELHEIRKKIGIEPKDFFSAMYLSILGKPSGPKAGWFLSVLDRDFLLQRFKEVTER